VRRLARAGLAEYELVPAVDANNSVALSASLSGSVEWPNSTNAVLEDVTKRKVAMWASRQLVISRIADSGKPGLMLEDDVVFHPDFARIVTRLLSHLEDVPIAIGPQRRVKSGTTPAQAQGGHGVPWEMIYLGHCMEYPDRLARCRRVPGDGTDAFLTPIFKGGCTHAILFSAWGARRVHDTLSTWDVGYLKGLHGARFTDVNVGRGADYQMTRASATGKFAAMEAWPELVVQQTRAEKDLDSAFFATAPDWSTPGAPPRQDVIPLPCEKLRQHRRRHRRMSHRRQGGQMLL